MFENKLNERLSRIQNSAMKVTEKITKSAGVKVKRLSDANSMLTNNIAKKAQLKSVELLAIKSPADISNLYNLNNSSEFMHEMIEYQEEIKKVMNDSSQEIAGLINELVEDAKNGMDELFNVISSNAPNGSDVLIRQYQSAFQSYFRGIKHLNEYSGNIMESLESLSNAVGRSIDDSTAASNSHRKNKS